MVFLVVTNLHILLVWVLQEHVQLEKDDDGHEQHSKVTNVLFSIGGFSSFHQCMVYILHVDEFCLNTLHTLHYQIPFNFTLPDFWRKHIFTLPDFWKKQHTTIKTFLQILWKPSTEYCNF